MNTAPVNNAAINLNGSLDWEPFDIPGGTTKVDMALLRYERATRARVLAVKFPEGWARTEDGSYESAEELIIVHGTLEMSGLTIQLGDYGYFPAGWLRHDMRAPTEVLAFARFSGPARWVAAKEAAKVAAKVDESPDHLHTPLVTKAATEASPLGVGTSHHLHTQDQNDNTDSWLVQDVEETTATAGCELLNLETWEWNWIEQGAQLPATTRGFLRIPQP